LRAFDPLWPVVFGFAGGVAGFPVDVCVLAEAGFEAGFVAAGLG